MFKTPGSQTKPSAETWLAVESRVNRERFDGDFENYK
jgi:hypothetical protein